MTETKVADWIRPDNMNLQTRDGKYSIRDGTLRIYATDHSDGLYPFYVVGATRESGLWSFQEWTAGGHFDTSLDTPLDLIEVKPKRKFTVFVNWYIGGNGGPAAVAHLNRGDADEQATHDRFACTEHEITEGEGL